MLSIERYMLAIFVLLICFGSSQLLAQEAMPTLPEDASEQEGKRYEREKEEWIKRNPQVYEDLNKKTSIGSKEGTSSVGWEFSNAIIVENEIVKNIPSASQQQAIQSFSPQNITIKIIDNKYFHLYSNEGKIKIFEGEIKHGSVVENHENCPKCRDMDFELEEFSQEHIVLKQTYTPKNSKPFVAKYYFIRN